MGSRLHTLTHECVRVRSFSFHNTANRDRDHATIDPLNNKSNSKWRMADGSHATTPMAAGIRKGTARSAVRYASPSWFFGGRQTVHTHTHTHTNLFVYNRNYLCHKWIYISALRGNAIAELTHIFGTILWLVAGVQHAELNFSAIINSKSRCWAIYSIYCLLFAPIIRQEFEWHCAPLYSAPNCID